MAERLVDVPLALGHVPDALDQPVRRGVLAQVSQRALLEGPAQRSRPPGCGQGEQRGAPAARRLTSEREVADAARAARLGAVHVDDAHIRPQCPVTGGCSLPGCRGDFQVRLSAEHGRQCRAQQAGVVYEQDSDHVSVPPRSL
ncbi:hypothetical protein GCM10010359_40460 [Streptomyces morookaense]|nr:hypothetical protein GCM10010359_40460 [Streptomyces morookaense]